MTTYILGLNAWHGDTAAALFADGQLVAAAEEERFTRVKHWAGFPTRSIAYCLSEAGIGLDRVDHVAANSDPDAHRLRKMLYAVAQRPDPRMLLQRLRARRQRFSIAAELYRRFPGAAFKGEIHAVEHHLAHLASAFFASDFEDAVVLSIDGFGDFSSAAWGLGSGAELRMDDRIYFPHSLGLFYESLTQYLGFPKYGDEYKVMGLSAYGDRSELAKVQDIVAEHSGGTFRLNLKYFRHHREKIEFGLQDCEPSRGNLYSAELEGLLGPARKPSAPLEARHRNIASAVQLVYEHHFFRLLQALQARYKVDRLCLAGGCAMNSLANGSISTRSGFRRVYVQAAAGDAGGAIGSAAVIANRVLKRRPAPMRHAAWGPGASRELIEASLTENAAQLREARCRIEWIGDEDRLCRDTAARIAGGHVVGWFQGRMEWGPRALGNRSIICDPRRGDMKEILNLKIKRRESFRPFAPSVLREAVADWFEQDGDVPFMTQVFAIRPQRRAQIPAVTHVDGTGRLQTVTPEQNSRYYRLIGEFARLTGVPMVLNTSFNENEPIVCQPKEALDCFLRTDMDSLVLGDCLVSRRDVGGGA